MDNTNETNTDFATRLKYARETLRKISQTELGQKSGLPVSSITHFEAGDRKPSFDNLKKLSTALDVSTDYLLGQTDSTTHSEEGQIQVAFRNIENLSDYDKRIAAEFINMLAKKNETNS
jgi:transcriptional regulator with XRE-family HTH domain